MQRFRSYAARGEKQRKLPKPSSKEVVAVVYDKWLLIRGSKYEAFTVKVFFTGAWFSREFCRFRT